MLCCFYGCSCRIPATCYVSLRQCLFAVGILLFRYDVAFGRYLESIDIEHREVRQKAIVSPSADTFETLIENSKPSQQTETRLHWN